MSRSLRIILLALALGSTLGCVRGCTSSRPPIHVIPNMDSQPRYEAQESSTFFADGMVMRTPPAGTVPRRDMPLEMWTDPGFRSGRDAAGEALLSNPLDITEPLLARGENRYVIYCAPCHDRRGTGRGILFSRANIPTTSMHLERVVQSTDGELFDVITNGVGLMPGYAYPLSPEDRWAVVAYVRQMQSEYVE